MIRVGDKVSFRSDLIYGYRYDGMMLYETMVKGMDSRSCHDVVDVNECGDAFKVHEDGYWYNKEMIENHDHGLYTVKLPINVWNDESSELETNQYVLWKCINSGETRLHHEEYKKSEHGYKWIKNMTLEEIRGIDERYVAFSESV